ncbi:MAG TPA: outer membrane lipid asymmetry maintenance protein MlaD [Rickettsiales bacterium]|nr:outer membrane lipid asymmetry maintenance protein MlaD [Rickettsiales bacterium]
MKNNTFETLIGALVLLIAVIFTLMASKISDGRQKLASGYVLNAQFNNIEGLNIGADVKVSGVKIGSVLDINLNDNYMANVKIKLPKDLLVPTDSIFKISTSGLIGNKFVNIKIGADEENLKDGETAEFTESTMDLEDLIGKFVFNNENKNENN